MAASYLVDDEQFMRRALELARMGTGLTSPNPMVGALVVQAGAVKGEGCHRFQEKKHAEVLALEEAAERARGGTLYLNLEPCCHYGRTPPCTDLIRTSGIQRVVVAMTDPNPLVAGKGIQILRESGIEVQTGLMENEARKLNEAFSKYIVHKIPFVTLKAGMTLDGKIASIRTAERRITSDASWQKVHQLRHAADAILVGIQTVLSDDPRLTDRSNCLRHYPLWRIVLDRRLRISPQSRLAQTLSIAPLMIFCGEEHPPEKKTELESLGIEVIVHPSQSGIIPLSYVLEELGRRQITSLLVEGGGQTHFEFLKSGCADKVIFFIAPKILGGRNALSVVAGEGFGGLSETVPMRFEDIERLGPDVMIESYITQHLVEIQHNVSSPKPLTESNPQQN